MSGRRQGVSRRLLLLPIRQEQPRPGRLLTLVECVNSPRRDVSISGHDTELSGSQSVCPIEARRLLRAKLVLNFRRFGFSIESLEMFVAEGRRQVHE